MCPAIVAHVADRLTYFFKRINMINSSAGSLALLLYVCLFIFPPETVLFFPVQRFLLFSPLT